MSWVDPTDVGDGNAVPTTWFDIIAENQRVLHRGNGHTPLVVAGGADITLGGTGNFFSVESAGATVQRIDGTDWTIGSFVVLYFDENTILTYDCSRAASGDYLPIKRFDSTSISDSGSFAGGLGNAVAMLIKRPTCWVLMNSY